MKKRYIQFSALLLFSIVIVLIHRHYHNYLQTPVVVDMKEVARIPTEATLAGTRWFVIDNSSQARWYESYYGITLPINNYDTSFLLVAEGRAIKQLTYKRSDKYIRQSRIVYLGSAIFDEEYTPHIYHIYKIPCVRVLTLEQIG